MLRYKMNIEGCIEKYRDLITAKDWLEHAKKELSPTDFTVLMVKLWNWFIDESNQHDLKDDLLALFAIYDADGGFERQEKWKVNKIRIHEEEQQRQQEALRKEEQQVIAQAIASKREALQARIHASFEHDFINATETFSADPDKDLIGNDEFERMRIRYVKRWAERELQYVLDDNQAEVVAEVNGNIKVVARAGSGKTRTLVTRSLFLLKHCNVPANKMLLLAFNKKAALEMKERISKACDGAMPHVMTFHALAYALVHPGGELLYDDTQGNTPALSRVIQEIIDDLLQKPDYQNRIRKVMLSHFKDDWEAITDGKYDRCMAEHLRFRRSLPHRGVGGEYVKSWGEKLIADFLFEHDLPYKYELNHYWNGRNYRPDFTLFKEASGGVVIEYFGLEGDPDYDEMSLEKREYWRKKKDWDLIEYTPRDISFNGLESFKGVIRKELEEHGFQCVPLSEEEIWKRIKERAIDNYTKAVVSFIGRCRQRILSKSDLRTLIGAHGCHTDAEKQFLDLANNIYEAYLERLSSTDEDDFNGLIQRAIQAIDSGNTVFLRKNTVGDLQDIRYISIDEYQDFSELFHKMIQAIRNRNANVEVFCVGDDWQAINGFAGSDLKYFNEFSKYIGESRQLYLTTNYRSANAIVNAGNALMNGRGKPAHAQDESLGSVYIVDMDGFKPSSLESELHPGDVITPVVLRICGKCLEDGLDIVMLSRKHTLPYYVNAPAHVTAQRDDLGWFLESIRSHIPKDMKNRVTISTAHGYKGLEKRAVIILDAIERSYPVLHPDWIFFKLFGDDLEKIIDEERRLFYVSMTRAKDELFIVTETRQKTQYLNDLQSDHEIQQIDWDEYPPTVDVGAGNYYIILVGNQEDRGSQPTYTIKDLLSACGYKFRSLSKKTWVKECSKQSFSIDNIKKEVWAQKADGVDVRVMDGSDTLIERYVVDNGVWRRCIS